MADQALTPIFSRMQIGPGLGPEMYSPAPGCAREISTLWTRFLWHHHDLCLFHQAIYRELSDRAAAMKDCSEDLRRESATFKRAPHDAESEEHEWNGVMLSRAREHLCVLEQEYESLRGFGDHHTVIGLWAMVEQYCGRTLVAVENHLWAKSAGAESPHRFQELRERFLTAGISVETCKSYLAIDECRVLNNKIKHLGYVDAQLAGHGHFAGLQGLELSRVPLMMQFYSDGVFEFIGALLEKSSELTGGSWR